VPVRPLAVDDALLCESAGQVVLCFDPDCATSGEDSPRAERLRPWAWLLRHVWEVDVSGRDRCLMPLTTPSVLLYFDVLWVIVVS
jgi:hypothetical protein